MTTSMLDQAAPTAGYGAVSEDKAQLLVKARMERGSLSDPLGPEDRSVLSFHHISYSLPKRKFGIISAGRKTILNDLRCRQFVRVAFSGPARLCAHINIYSGSYGPS